MTFKSYTYKVIVFLLSFFSLAPTLSVHAKDFQHLKRIPTIEIIRHANVAPTIHLMFEHLRADTLSKLEALEPDLKTLMWLAFLDQHWGRDGLHTYFFLFGGDFAPHVLAALRRTKMEKEAQLFSEAMALFGPVYPQTEEARQKFFAWGRPGQWVDEHTTIPNDLNAFDHALMRISEAFGTQADFAARITAYAENTPSLLAWAEKARSDMTEEQRFTWFLRQLTVQSWQNVRFELNTWPKLYRQFFYLHVFNIEFANGNVHQFFYNSSGDFAPEVVATLHEFGLSRHAKILSRGIDMFAKPYPSNTQLRRDRHFHKGWGNWDKKLSKLTDEMDDGMIWQKMLEIAKANDLLPR